MVCSFWWQLVIWVRNCLFRELQWFILGAPFQSFGNVVNSFGDNKVLFILKMRTSILCFVGSTKGRHNALSGAKFALQVNWNKTDKMRVNLDHLARLSVQRTAFTAVTTLIYNSIILVSVALFLFLRIRRAVYRMWCLRLICLTNILCIG